MTLSLPGFLGVSNPHEQGSFSRNHRYRVSIVEHTVQRRQQRKSGKRSVIIGTYFGATVGTETIAETCRCATMTSDHISAIMTYVTKREDGFGL
jgi:hypothetical protein